MPHHFDTAQLSANPPTLLGRTIRLEPLHRRHAADLHAAAEPRVFTYHNLAPDEWSQQGFEAYIERSLRVPGRVAFAMALNAEDRAVGTSSYLELRPEHRGLEIGYTWIGPQHQGTRVNPESKLLLLTYAFETLGALRVQLKCDARNLQSQAAISKLGAVREGVLRRHVIMPDGYLRDSVMYSIIDTEWPDVKVGLEQRLAG